MDDSYDDILLLARPRNGKHAPMPLKNRAAQFLPFSALTGLEAVMAEEARLTDPFVELGEDAQGALDGVLRTLLPRMGEQPLVKVVFFVPDERKPGGRYETKTERLRRVDEGERTLVFADKTVVHMENVLSLEPLT